MINKHDVQCTNITVDFFKKKNFRKCLLFVGRTQMALSLLQQAFGSSSNCNKQDGSKSPKDPKQPLQYTLTPTHECLTELILYTPYPGGYDQKQYETCAIEEHRHDQPLECVACCLAKEVQEEQDYIRKRIISLTLAQYYQHTKAAGEALGIPYMCCLQITLALVVKAAYCDSLELLCPFDPCYRYADMIRWERELLRAIDWRIVSTCARDAIMEHIHLEKICPEDAHQLCELVTRNETDCAFYRFTMAEQEAHILSCHTAHQ
jgi:hypothetical protein